VYRLVFCDLDGTLATFDGEVRSAVRMAMQAVVDAGTWITIATGRGYQTLRPFLDRVIVNAPLVCCNGGLIVEPSTAEVLYVKPLPLQLARDLVHLGQEEGFEMWFYLDDLRTMLENPAGGPGFLLRQDGVTISAAPDLVIATESVELTQQVAARVQQHVGNRARVLASSPKMVEVILPGVSKAWAMAWVAAYLGVKREETIGIGDGDNDPEMMEWAGLGIAMGNASSPVKAAADWVVPSVGEDGLAVALRRFVLNS